MSLLILFSPSVSTPTTTIYVKVAGVWKAGTIYTKVGGIWHSGAIKAKTGGTWH